MTSGAENIHLSAQTPKSCKFLGSITNPNVHGDMDLRSSSQDVQKDDINFIKNEGARLGANVVVLVYHKKIPAKRYYVKSSNYFTIYEHDVDANAYFCPPGIIYKSKQGEYTNFKIPEDHITQSLIRGA